MLEGYLGAFANFGSPLFVLAILLGATIGIVVGVLPGIGAVAAVALFLPFAFGREPIAALAFMAAIFGSSVTGGSVTAIVMGIPGDATNAATVLDGYPMCRKGQGSRAIGAAATASGLGGLLSPILALAMIPLILPFIMVLRLGDMVFLVILGLVFIAVLTRGSMLKGLVSAGIGFLLAFIGYHSGTGIHRYDFNIPQLYEGLNLIPVILGLFAMPDTILLMASGATIAPMESQGQGMRQIWEGAKDVFRHWTLWLRSTIVGYIIGIIPGIGALTAMWIAYGQAKATSKHPEEFGTGTIEGVIAPESANNAVQGGALLTTCAFGIPGSGGMTVLLGGFLILGLTPGPSLMIDHLDIAISILLANMTAAVVAAFMVLFVGKYLLKATVTPARILGPLVLVAIYVGTFAARETFVDLIVLTVVGFIGLLAATYGFNRAAMLLAFVLGLLFEKYLFLSIKTHGALFFMRPISLILIAIIIVVLVGKPISDMRARRRLKQS